MQEIKCPKCNEVFQVDEAGYAAILKQVHDREFHAEVRQLEQQYKDRVENAIALAKAEQQRDYDQAITLKTKELDNYKLQVTNYKAEQIRKYDQLEKEKDQEIAQKNTKIEQLQGKINEAEKEKALAVSEAVKEKNDQLANKDREIINLQAEIRNSENVYALKEKSLIDRYSAQLKAKDDEVEFYKDFKAKQSTKMVGESLEQHCLTEFNRMRAVGFQTAYFDKDNDAKTGSKGDFIFRDYDEYKNEFISIMFEMKNETDTAGKKHKNEDFFKELDKDRKEKNCEYAVLVSLLEPENEFYNVGIVDVSYMSNYPKMYVIRPQFFIPLIAILRNAALSSIAYKQEIERIRSQEIDITNFENKLSSFVQSIGKNYEQAAKKSNSIIDEIDNAISQLNKVKDNFLGLINNLRLANEKANDITIRKLTYKNPTMQEKFHELHIADNKENM